MELRVGYTMKQLLFWVFYGAYAFAHHLVNEPNRWTGQENLSDDGSEFVKGDVEPRWRSRDWGRDGHRRRWDDGRRRGHSRGWDHDEWDNRDWSNDDWNKQDWSNDDWNKQDWSNDISMNDEILNGDANCVKCPQVVPICKCPPRQHCQFVKRTCNRCAYYICRK